MGYDVHITRREDWHDEDGPEITRAEWFHLVSRDPSLQLSREVIVENDQGEQVSLQEPTLTLWLEWPGRDEGRAESILWHSNGNIYAKNPDRETLRKMYLIAGVLQAKVQGDDGEVYNAGGVVTDTQARRWWKVW